MYLPVRELGIDLVHHLNHVPGGDFLGVLVAREIRTAIRAGCVTEQALLSERPGKCHHRRANIGIRRQHFQILRGGRSLPLGRVLRRSGEENEGDYHQKYG